MHPLGYSVKIGGPNKIVNIDKSKFGRRKYQRGHAVTGQWVLGGVGVWKDLPRAHSRQPLTPWQLSLLPEWYPALQSLVTAGWRTRTWKPTATHTALSTIRSLSLMIGLGLIRTWSKECGSEFRLSLTPSAGKGNMYIISPISSSRHDPEVNSTSSITRITAFIPHNTSKMSPRALNLPYTCHHASTPLHLYWVRKKHASVTSHSWDPWTNDTYWPTLTNIVSGSWLWDVTDAYCFLAQ